MNEITFTVSNLIEELKKLELEGYGDLGLFVPAECGYSGASIIEGYELCCSCHLTVEERDCENCNHDKNGVKMQIVLNSDDM